MDSRKPQTDFACQQLWEDIPGSGRKYLHIWGDQLNYHSSILIVHGLGEHGGRYHSLAREFAAAGHRVIAFDQQGHGQSTEKRGCITSYDSMLDDIAAMLTWIGDEQPRILFGHSMGGNLVLNYALRRPELQPDAVISSSPMIKAVRPPHPVFEFILRMLMRVAPNMTIGSDTDPAKLMSDPKEQQALADDVVFHSSLSLRLGAALLDSGRWVLKHADQLKTPMLLTHGTADTKTCHKASIEFARLSTTACQLEILPERMHDPFRDVEREQALEKYFQFMDSIRNKVAA